MQFVSLMDICYLKKSELEQKLKKYEGRVVLRGGTVKNDSGSNAVFTDQSSSTSQMTAAKVMDLIAKIPGCARQAADAVSSYTHAKMEHAPSLLKNSKVRLFRYLDTSTETQMAQIMVQHGRPSRSSGAKSVRSPPVAGLLRTRQIEKVPLEHGWEEVPNWECLFVNREKGLFLSVYVDDIKMVGEKQNTDPMWKVLIKHLELGEPTLHSTRMRDEQR